VSVNLMGDHAAQAERYEREIREFAADPRRTVLVLEGLVPITLVKDLSLDPGKMYLIDHAQLRSMRPSYSLRRQPMTLTPDTKPPT